ncbi:hypothetical protein HY500_00370 [Candidatus Woesearchaeota archaeon]|nr:hypothetical protein [Candidatus Woesearchaeota archaeon]
MNKERYGILLTISSESDFSPELLKKGDEPVSFSSVEEAVQFAEEDSRKPRLIKDWVYDIVCLYNGRTGGRPIESYHSVPRFERIAPTR